MPETVQVQLSVAKILSTTAQGGAIFTGLGEDGKSVRVVASHSVLSRPPVTGELWQVRGFMECHPRYGEQLAADACSFLIPHGRLTVQYLSNSPHFSGIGIAKAEALYRALGNELALALTNGNIEALEAVLTPSMAQKIVGAWQARLPEAELMAFLDSYGFDLRLASRISRAWGDKAREMIELNPYFMLAFSGWATVDRAAKRLGISLDDDHRLIGAVESALYDRLQRSHTLVDHDKLARLVRKNLGSGDATRAISLAVAELAVYGDSSSGYQASGAWSLERGIEKRIKAMLAGEAAEQGNLLLDLESGDEWSNTVLDEVEREQGFLLNAEQRSGALMPFSSAVSLLTGGAGVGKTTVLRAILRIAHSKHYTVVQMALAGRAAKRMSESTGFPAMTIAKFLLDAKAGKIVLNGDALIVVDEASMLDLPTLYKILRFLPDGARLLLVGDPAQLPPIGFGLVFHRLVESDLVPATNLVQVHRQAESTGIPGIAAAIRRHEVPSIEPYTSKKPGVSFITSNKLEVMDALRRLSHDWSGEEWQILAAVKGGFGGIEAINTIFHADAVGDLDGPWFVPGEPVIHLVNDVDLNLMNGTLGRVCEVNEKGLRIEFEGVVHTFDWSTAKGRVEHAYAISVHKSQGSQFRRVAVVVGQSRLLDHALIYTAVTRGVEQVVFIGDRDAFSTAIINPALAQMREVAFRV